MMKPFIASLLIALSVSSMAQTDKTKEQWIAEAQSETEKWFSKYHAVCNGSVVVRTGKSSYLEFNGRSAAVAVLGLYHISNSDRLNGTLWSGKIVVDMGNSSRPLIVAEQDTRKPFKWSPGREAEFDFTYADGRWQLNGKIYSPDWYLQPDVQCKAITHRLRPS